MIEADNHGTDKHLRPRKIMKEHLSPQIGRVGSGGSQGVFTLRIDNKDDAHYTFTSACLTRTSLCPQIDSGVDPFGTQDIACGEDAANIVFEIAFRYFIQTAPLWGATEEILRCCLRAYRPHNRFCMLLIMGVGCSHSRLVARAIGTIFCLYLVWSAIALQLTMAERAEWEVIDYRGQEAPLVHALYAHLLTQCIDLIFQGIQDIIACCLAACIYNKRRRWKRQSF